MKNIIDKELLLDILQRAIGNLYKNDDELIKCKSSERSIVASLKCHLKGDKRLSNYDIDVEYNREGENGETKRDYDGTPNTADLLIHTRLNTSEGNLLYLEAKTYFNVSENEKQIDIHTIQYCKEKYCYKYGIFICFNMDSVYYELFDEQRTVGVFNIITHLE